MLEIDERVTLVGYTSDPQATEHAVQFDEDGKVKRGYRGQQWDINVGSLAKNSVAESKHGEPEIVRGLSGEAVQIMKKPGMCPSSRLRISRSPN